MKRKAKKLLSLLLTLALVLGLASTALAANFSDVPSGSWYAKDVYKAVDTGLINGYPDNTFGPDKNMTYAEAIKLAAVMYKIATTGSNEFETSSPWYKAYADYAKNVGVISKDYDWNKPATRAGYMEIFSKAIPDHVSSAGMKALVQINNIADNSIPDVSMSHPQAAAIYKLYRAGIVQGSDTQHNCNPDSNIKRSEVAAILTRMMNAGDRLSFSLGEQTEELKITSQPKDATVNVGGNATFSVAASGGKAPYTYEWRKIRPDGVEIDIFGDSYDGKNSATLTVKNSSMSYDNGAKYFCIVTDAEGKKVTSSKATLTVKEEAAELKITTQPANTTANVGETAKFTVAVTGGKPTYNYKWYAEQPNGITATFATNSATLTLNNLYATQNGDKIYCVITDADGKKVTSNKATLTVKSAKLSATLPSTISATAGVSFSGKIVPTITNGSGNYSYEWYYKVNSGSWEKSGDSDNDYNLGSGALTAGDKWQIYCIVTDKNTSQKATTNTCSFTVNPGALKITSHPISKTVNDGQDVAFSVAAEGGTGPYKYQWYAVFPKGYNGGQGGASAMSDYGTISGTKSYYLSIKKAEVVDTGVKFYCVVTDANGKTAESNKATLTVNATTPTKVTRTAEAVATKGQAFRTEFKFADYGINSGSVTWDDSTNYSTFGGLKGPEYSGSYVAVYGTPTSVGVALCRMVITSGNTTFYLEIKVYVQGRA